MAAGIVLTLILLFVTLIVSYIRVLMEWRRKVYITSVPFTKNKNRQSTDHLSVEPVVKEYDQAPGPAPWPILGNLALLGQHENPFQAFTELSYKYGDAYSLTLGTTRCFVANNLELIQEVLSQNGKFFGGRPDFLRFHKLFGGDRNNSLALCDWSNLQQKRRNLARRHCSPRDNSDYYRKMCDIGGLEMAEFLKVLTAKVGSGKELHVKEILQTTAANMFCHYMCSIRFDYEDQDFLKVVNCFDKIFWDINEGYAVDFLPWLSPCYLKLLNRISSWSTEIRKFILKRIIEDRELSLDVEEDETDFTDALLKSIIADPSVTRDTIIYMLEDFIGGHSAIGNLVMISLGYVALNPHVGVQIQAEIDHVTERKRPVTLFDKEDLPYTMAVLFETLRYSSSPIVPHVATEDVTISGYGITKGTVVFINNYKLNTSEKYWDNPKQFDPTRFLDEEPASDGATKPRYRLKKNLPHFLPFSIGKRTCIGQNLVRGFGFVMLASIMQNFNISSIDKNCIKMYPACVALPPETYPLTFTPRSHLE
ncbi:cytochrome P450 307a1-like [Lutzomyia longipalpis]|uniref:cytochrome P450 307a1-like n=1 Tax=Lutzomyia longipalpis TaxID=7200 RepID=UPI002483FBED|nr:cytochrome P450 307a1-like [Lutzomyia longipalpis]